jgi:eukaryotic-like serine/threonine-protein kinase
MMSSCLVAWGGGMQRFVSSLVASTALMLLMGSPTARAAEALAFGDIVGWWCAEPVHAGEASRVCLHFLDEQGKATARISLVGIRGHDAPIGTVTIVGHRLDMQPYPFPLEYDAAAGTLSGHLPEAAVPVYKIPVVFRRSEPLAKPTPPSWALPKPTVKWTTDLKSPVWAGLERDAATGLIFAGTDGGTLHAIDGSGAQRWSFDTRGAVKARPAVIGNDVFVASDAGFLFRLAVRDGREIWRARIDAGSPPRIPASQEKSRWDRYGSSVVADARRAYVGSRDGHLYALDLATGREAWRVKAGDMMTATPALYRDLVIFAAFDGKVRALEVADGRERWSYDARLAVAGDLTVDQDRVFLGSRTYDLIALDAGTGRELWKHYYWFSWIESPPVVRDGVVYTGSSDGVGIFAVDAVNGTRRWKAEVPGWAWARPAVTEDLVIAGTVGAGAFPGSRAGALVAADRTSGRMRWLYLDPPSKEVADKRAEWGFASDPVVADGIAYAADLTGRVHAIVVNESR